MCPRRSRLTEIFQLLDDLHHLFEILLVSTQNQHPQIVNRFNRDFALESPKRVGQRGWSGQRSRC